MTQQYDDQQRITISVSQVQINRRTKLEHKHYLSKPLWTKSFLFKESSDLPRFVWHTVQPWVVWCRIWQRFHFKELPDSNLLKQHGATVSRCWSFWNVFQKNNCFTSSTCSARLTIEANVAIATDPSAFGCPAGLCFKFPWNQVKFFILYGNLLLRESPFNIVIVLKLQLFDFKFFFVYTFKLLRGLFWNICT